MAAKLRSKSAIRDWKHDHEKKRKVKPKEQPTKPLLAVFYTEEYGYY